MSNRCLFILLLVASLWPTLSVSQDAKTYIHPRAKQYIPMYLSEIDKFLPEDQYPEPAYSLALTEHETCIHFKHIFCWNPRAELKNNREQGVGLGQTTRAWDRNGKLRFDNLEGMKKAYQGELYEANWENFKNRPDLQMRISVLMVRESYNRYKMIKDPHIRYHFADIDYNGGPKDLMKARQACAIAKDCDPQVWFGQTERYNVKSNKPDQRYGGRSMREINNHHARDVFFTRLPKFQRYVQEVRREQQSGSPPSATGAP